MAAYGYATAGEIVNSALVEVGLSAVADPYGSSDDVVIQMQTLLATAGKMLLRDYNWQRMFAEHSITTDAADSGVYTLPTDFLRKIPQTGWDTTKRVPLVGPLSPQDWTYLVGRDLSASTIYVSFRLQDGSFSILPNDPVPDGVTITFEYLSQNWCLDASDSDTPIDKPGASADTVLFDEVMMIHMLKARWLGSRGFDNSQALSDFNRAYAALTGQDKGGEIISAGGGDRSFPLLNSLRNTPDTGYGL